ncbi:TonB-dependent receptor, partial [marine sediment metagenome]
MPDIRGVSGNGGAGGFNSISGGAKGRVSTLIDGVAQPFVADLSGDSGMWDLQQIEVFRGPQSTSNGRNSIAGSVF